MAGEIDNERVQSFEGMTEPGDSRQASMRLLDGLGDTRVAAKAGYDGGTIDKGQVTGKEPALIRTAIDVEGMKFLASMASVETMNLSARVTNAPQLG